MNNWLEIEPGCNFEWAGCCRLCLSKNAKLDLFESETGFNDLSYKIQCFLGILVNHLDFMPKKLCVTCLQQLHSWHEFKLQCLEKEKYLKTKLLQFISTGDQSSEIGVEAGISPDPPFSVLLQADIVTNVPAPIPSAKTNNTIETQKSDRILTHIKAEPIADPSFENIVMPSADLKANICKIPNSVIDNTIETPTDTGHLTNNISSNQQLSHDQVEWNTVFTIKNEGVTFDENVSIKMEYPQTESVFPQEIEKENSDDSLSYNLRPRKFPRRYIDNDDDDHQEITTWKCEVCLLFFSSRMSYLMHQDGEECSGHTQGFPCLMCKKNFFSMNSLAKHNVFHLRIAWDVNNSDLKCCKVCDAKFADSERYKMHLKNHPSDVVNNLLESKNIACSLCVDRFYCEDLLYDHRFAAHGILDERVTCITCTLKFRSQADLDEHSKTHNSRSVARKKTGSTNRCRHCYQFFDTKEELEKHEQTKHIPYRCRQCQLPFNTRSALLLHYRIHNDTAPRRVDDSKKSLENEVENPKSCKYCNVEFKYKSDYDVHYSSHLKSKRHNYKCDTFGIPVIRYQCSHCPQLFGNDSETLNHCLEHHKGLDSQIINLKYPAKRLTENVHSCKICSLDFKDQAALNFHNKRNHPT